LKSVCHITTVHPSRDTRIFYKECKSLARAGFDVKLIVINGESFIEDGVEAIGVPCKFSGRLARFFRASRAAYRKAFSTEADIYHFHDPEFLFWAIKLKKKGKKVFYDVHEDLPRQMMSKYWIYKPVRKSASWLIERLENHYAAQMDGIVTVTDHIGQRFAKFHQDVHLVKNYPVLRETEPDHELRTTLNEVFYVGSITPERGITGLVTAMELVRGDVTLNLAGLFSREQYRLELSKLKGWKQVKEVGYANRRKVDELMERSFAGLVTLHPVPNYPDALPVKMFEYMAAGLPVIASDFPLWREIIEGNDCGICVDPLNIKEIANAIDRLFSDRELARRMGSNGLKAIKEKYNWSLEEKNLLEAYNSLISD
jgi:glycosyltransferase involved in cell wall biosynthesis